MISFRNRTRLLSTALICGFLSFPGIGKAADESPNYFAFFPEGTPFELGRGFVQNNLAKTFGVDCLDFEKRPGLSGEGADNISLKTLVTTSYSSLLDVFGLDVQASVHYVGAGVDAKFQQNRRLASTSRNVTIVVQASADYAPVTLRNVSLRGEYASMLQSGRIDDFIETCGARFPYRERLGVRLFAAITIQEASSELQEKTSASIDASYGSGSLSASARAAFNKEMETAQKSNRVEVTVFARGGDATEVFEGVVKQAIKDKVSVDEIGDALSSFAKTLTSKKAATIGFDVADMPGLQIALKDPWSLEKQKRLHEIVDQYRGLADKRGVLSGLISKQDPRYVKFSEAEIQEFVANVAVVDKALLRTVAVHRSCLAAIAPTLDPCVLDSAEFATALAVIAPEPLSPPRGDFAVAARVGGDAKNQALTNWKLLPPHASRSALQSPAAANLPADLEFDGAALFSYKLRLIERLKSAVAEIQRYMLTYVVYADDLDSLELYAETTSDGFRAGYADKRYSIEAWGSNDLIKLEPDYSDKASFQDRKQFHSLPLLAGFIQYPPDCKCLPGSPNAHQWALDYADHDLMMNINNIGIDFVAVIRGWVADGKANSGKGEIKLQARDKFAGLATLTLITFDWDYDDKFDVARVFYELKSGEPLNLMYLTNVRLSGDQGNQFPMLHRPYSWQVELASDGKAHTYDFAPLVDKWGQFNTKICKISLTPTANPTPAGLPFTFKPEFYPDKGKVTAAWGPSIMLVKSKIAFDVAVDFLVQTKRPSLFDTGFMKDFAGCN